MLGFLQATAFHFADAQLLLQVQLDLLPLLQLRRQLGLAALQFLNSLLALLTLRAVLQLLARQ
ncbi:hypothetical protein D9M71_745640 [compost metagenome]